MGRLTWWRRLSESTRICIGFVTAIVVVIVLASLAGADWGDDTPKTADQVRTEHCERSWQNSAEKQTGASKTRFVQRCIADLKALEGATR